MTDVELLAVSDRLLVILEQYKLMRDDIRQATTQHRGAIYHEITEGEKSAARLLGLISGPPS